MAARGHSYFDTIKQTSDAWKTANDELLDLAAVSAEDPDLGDLLVRIQDGLRTDQYTDFSLMIRNVVEAVQNSVPGIANAIGSLQHLMVDEYQDVNPCQEELIRLLHQRSSTTTTSCLIGWLDRLCWVVWVMDAESFERVYDSLQEFHAFFAASFGRKQWREHSGNYLQALLVQDQERRNAENLSESVGISARAMQRFLTEARWSDETVIGRLQEYLAPRLGHPEAVWVFDGSDFPKQGRKSAGVARQYCGRLGKVANCQGGMFLA